MTTQGKFIFEEDRFLRRKRRRIVERRNREINHVRSLLSSKNKCVPQHAANERMPIRINDFARLTFCQDQVFARH